ncbi:MAG: hypothetical protein P1P93_12125, partial [Gammaproteobacteria bacterium]|nr:hypothetical protein [Gammaproteobacteria bacterium]
MQQWQQSKSAWTNLTPAGWAEAGRPEKIPFVKPPVELGKRLTNKQQVLEQVQKLYGDQKLYNTGGLPFMLNSKALAE